MNAKFYKCCAVPMCKNTSFRTPEKLFIHVPKNKQIRKKWLILAKRDPELLSPSSRIYFCEDHFDLQNDMDNYMQYITMGTVSQIRMKTGCLPTKFTFQPKEGALWRPDPQKEYKELEQITPDGSQQRENLNNDVPTTGSDNMLDATDNLSMYCDNKDPNTLLHDTGHNDEPMRHVELRCNVCDGAITGFRYTCVQCSDFDLCGACEADNKHQQHYVLRIPAPRPAAEAQFVLATIRSHLMQKLDPIIKPEQDWDDTVSIKCEVKSEHEDDDYNMEPTPEPEHEVRSSDTSREQTYHKDITTTTIISIKEEPGSESPDEYEASTYVLPTELVDTTHTPMILIDAGKIINMPNEPSSSPQRVVKRGLLKLGMQEAVKSAKKICIRPAFSSESDGNESRLVSQSMRDVEPDTNMIEVTVPPAAAVKIAKTSIQQNLEMSDPGHMTSPKKHNAKRKSCTSSRGR